MSNFGLLGKPYGSQGMQAFCKAMVKVLRVLTSSITTITTQNK